MKRKMDQLTYNYSPTYFIVMSINSNNFSANISKAIFEYALIIFLFTIHTLIQFQSQLFFQQHKQKKSRQEEVKQNHLKSYRIPPALWRLQGVQVLERFVSVIVCFAEDFTENFAKNFAMDNTLICGPFTKKLFDACWLKLAATHKQFNVSISDTSVRTFQSQQREQMQSHSHTEQQHHTQQQLSLQQHESGLQTKEYCHADRTVCGRPSPRTEQLRELQSIFHSIGIYPTEAQVYEMIQFARRCSHSSTAALNAEDINHHTLTFGEFCSVVNEFITNSNVPRPVPKWLNQTFLCKIDQAEKEAFLNPRSSATNLDIFLGGSCNPTTWRKDIVIPELKRLGITYYNPQVEHWTPELIELEDQAKQNSEILFFVVDNQTRAIASMMEIAFIAATKRKLILVISDFTRDNCKNGISDVEFEMLLRAREYLRDVAERQGIPVFTEIPPAINCAARVLRENIAPQDLERVGDELIPVRQGHISVGDKLFRMFAAFERIKQSNQNNQFAFADLKSAFRAIHERELPDDLLKRFTRDYLAKQNSAISLSRSSSSESPDDEEHVPRKQFKKRNTIVIREKLSKSTISKLEKIELNLEQFYCVMSELYQMFESQETRKVENSKTISNLLVAKFSRVLQSVKSVSSQMMAGFVSNNDGQPEIVNITSQQVSQTRITHAYSSCASASLHSSRTSLFDSHELTRSGLPSHRHSLVANSASTSGHRGSLHKYSIHHAKYFPHSSKSTASFNQKKKFGTSNISVSTSSLASSLFYNTDKSLYIAGIRDEDYANQVPLLKKFAITYATHKRNSWTSARMVPVEAAHFDRSKVILFVIQMDSMEIPLMVTAAYYIGMQYNVVLCIQNIDPDKIQPKVRLSESAIKDYNRGRSYLSDFATKVGVPVFNDLKEAFHCCVEKVHEQ